MRDSGYARHPESWYAEEPWAVDILLDAEPFEGLCWDPAAGGGNIPRQCRARGLEVIASDLIDRRQSPRVISLGLDTSYPFEVQDFFEATRVVDNVISNPPFGRRNRSDMVEAWVRHAMPLARRKVAVLARLAFLEGKGRDDFFATMPLARVLVSRRRMSIPPGDSDAPRKGGTIAMAWYVFEHGYTGAPTVGRI